MEVSHDAASEIYKTFRVDSADPTLGEADHCNINVGGVDLGLHCSDHHKNPEKFDTNEIAQIVVYHIIRGKFDAFCVQGISTNVLTTVLWRIKQGDPAWEYSECANPDHGAPSLSHVIFFKTTVMTFVAKAKSTLKEDKFYKHMVEEFQKFADAGLVDELPVDSGGFVGIFKLVSMDRYVKILSLSLPPLKEEPPLQHEHEEIYRNLSLKKALYTLFCSSDWICPTDINRKSVYFVYGSIEVTESMELLRSSVHEAFTAGKIIMMRPQDDFKDFNHPNCTKVLIGRMRYFDPEQLVPLRKRGLTSFMYSKEALTLAIYKCKPRDAVSADKGIYNYPCGGKFLIFPVPEDPVDVKMTNKASGKAVKVKKEPDDEQDKESGEAVEVKEPDVEKDKKSGKAVEVKKKPDEQDKESTRESTDKAMEEEKPEEKPDEALEEEQDEESTEEATEERDEVAAEESTNVERHEDLAEATKESIDQELNETSEESTEESTVDATEESALDTAEESAVDVAEEMIVDATEESTVDATEESTVDATEESTVDATEESTVDATEESTVDAAVGASKESIENSASKTEQSKAEAIEESAAEEPEQSTAEVEPEQSTAEEPTRLQ